MRRLILALFALTALSVNSTLAAVKTNGDFSLSGGASLTFTEPLSILVTSTGTLKTLVFDEWVTTDTSFSNAVLQPLSFQIDGGAVQQTSADLVDNLNQFTSFVTPNDGNVFLDDIVVNAGQTVTFLVQTLTNTSTSLSFNPALSDFTFTGSAYITNIFGNALSDLTPVSSVPEPSALGGLFGLGALLVARRRV